MGVTPCGALYMRTVLRTGPAVHVMNRSWLVASVFLI